MMKTEGIWNEEQSLSDWGTISLQTWEERITEGNEQACSYFSWLCLNRLTYISAELLCISWFFFFAWDLYTSVQIILWKTPPSQGLILFFGGWRRFFLDQALITKGWRWVYIKYKCFHCTSSFHLMWCISSDRFWFKVLQIKMQGGT